MPFLTSLRAGEWGEPIRIDDLAPDDEAADPLEEPGSQGSQARGLFANALIDALAEEPILRSMPYRKSSEEARAQVLGTRSQA